MILYLYVSRGTDIEIGGRKQHTSAGLGIALRAPFQGFGECCEQPEQLRRPIGAQAIPYTMSQKPDFVLFELVPDGVATVRWTFPRAVAGRHHGGRIVVVRVHDNVAAITLPRRASGNSIVTQSVAWYGPDGRLIARHGS